MNVLAIVLAKKEHKAYIAYINVNVLAIVFFSFSVNVLAIVLAKKEHKAYIAYICVVLVKLYNVVAYRHSTTTTHGSPHDSSLDFFRATYL